MRPTPIAKPGTFAMAAAALALLPAACFQAHTVPIPDGGASGGGAANGTGATSGASGGSGGGTVTGAGGVGDPAGSGGRAPGGSGGNPGSGGSPGSGGAVSIDPTAYTDAMLLSSCSGPRSEILDGAWWSSVDAGSTIAPLALNGTPFTMSTGGYMGTGAHVTGTVAAGGYAVFGLNMLTGSVLYDASAYAGFSFWAKADKPMTIEVGVSQKDTDPQYGTCTALMTCYTYPALSVAIGTSWARHVVPFAALASGLLPNGGRVVASPSMLKHVQIGMPPGPFDFWLDELYFVRAR